MDNSKFKRLIQKSEITFKLAAEDCNSLICLAYSPHSFYYERNGFRK